MKNTGLYFGSSTGHVEGIADKVAQLLGIDAANVHNVADATPESALAYDLLIFGSSTWGYGDLQDDWEGFLPKLVKQDLSGKQFAVFGCGDSSSYPRYVGTSYPKGITHICEASFIILFFC